MNPFNFQQAKLVTNYEHSGILLAMVHDPERNQLFAAGTDNTVYRLDLAAEKPTLEKFSTPHDNYISGLAVSGEALISVGFDGRMAWTSLSEGQVIFSVPAHEGWVRRVPAFPDGSRVATVGDDMRVKVWNAADGRLVWQGEGHATRTPEGFLSALYAVAVSPDGQFVASADRAGEVRIWQAADGKPLHKFSAPTFYTYDAVKRSRSIGGIRSLAFSPDGSRLALAGIGPVSNVDGFVGPCRVELWDWQAGKHAFTGEDNHKAIFNHVIFHESLVVAAGGGDGGGLAEAWDPKSKEPAFRLKIKGHAQSFCFGDCGSRLYLAGAGGIQVWA